MSDAAKTHPTPDQLARYAVGELPEAEIAGVHQHVTKCAACRRAVDSTLTASPAATEPDGLPPVLTRSGKFEVLEKLGQGGMGAVYLARHTFLNQLVAIKVMNADLGANADARKRFLREMQATARLKHPNIVRALDAEALGDHLILVMEYIDGITLDRLVKQKGPLPVSFACRFVAQAAEALQYAHEHGMIHRDIKPANLMLTGTDEAVKVLDFGLARGPRDPAAAADWTRLQTVLGTPEYMAPEQATDASTVDIRADVYSLGCTLFFLLTGRPPFQAATAMNVLLAHLHAPPPSLREARPDAPAGLAAVVEKLFAKALTDRYPTPAKVAKALQPYLPAAKAKAGVPPRRPSAIKPVGKVEDEPEFGGPVASVPRSPEKAEPVLVNSIGMRLVWIPAGKFKMGAPPEEEERDTDEFQHEVEITRGFYLGAHAVTQEQYETVMGTNPSHFSAAGKGSDEVRGLDTRPFPVETVSWDDAVEFCRRLTEKERNEGKLGREVTYRLPTEAEWEYACRGGASSYEPFHFGRTLTPRLANCEGHLKRPAAVGSYPANAWGLYDLHGNVREWCGDWYDAEYYLKSPNKDPQGPQSGEARVLRGGCWGDAPPLCRAASRSRVAPAFRYSYYGLRVCCRLD